MLRSIVVVCAVLAAGSCGHRGDKPGGGSGSSSAAASGSDRATTAGGGSATGGSATAGSGGAAIAVADPEPAPVAEDATLGANIALVALGGHVVSPADAADHEWRASNLLDGFPVIRGHALIENSLGWRSETPAAPPIVIGFRQDREATVAAVVVDTASSDNLAGPAGIPKDVEVLVSTTSATDGFTSIAKATLPVAAGETVLRFPPTKAKWVKLAIASTHGDAPPQLGELQIYEAAGGTSIVADVEKNLLLPALGGSLVRFTSQGRDSLAVELIDGAVSDESGWGSSVGAVGDPAHFPQDFTFAFRDHRSAFVDRVVIDPTSGGRGYIGPKPNTKTWAKAIEVRTSDNPWTGFSTLAVLSVPAKPAPIVVPVGRAIRFLQIRILENNGDEATTLGEVQAFEGTPPGGRSLLAGRAIPIARAESAATVGTETAARREREPNDSQKQADRVDAPTPIGGGLATQTDRDMFLVPGATAGSQSLTVSLEGRPVIRTRVTVMDAAFATRYVLDPSKVSGTRARFSVATGPGDVFLQVLQPPAAEVVIWDTSGSMEHRVADLDAALHDFLGKVQPTDRVQLIRFDDQVAVLLKDFSGQSAQLVGALKDQVYAFGGTAIYDAISKGVELLDPVEGSRAIVMMTDGEDTSSGTEPPALWAALDRSRVRLYTIGLGDSMRNFVARAGMTAERVLADAALSTGGRYVYVADSSKLGGLYAEISAELRAPATYAIAATTSTATGTLAVSAAGDRLAVPPRVELVLDASGSMKRKSGAKTMMDTAKTVLTDVIARLPAGAQVALRVYGHRKADKQPGACEDTELLAPFGPLDRKQLTAQIKSVKPRGTTPIAFSIAAAGEDLRDAKGPAILILVTDGKEECGGDPAAAATALRAAGLDVTLSIVGFGLTDAADRDAMTRVAALGGGAFHDAQDATALKAAIDQAMAVPFTVVDAAGGVVGRGLIGGDPITVPEGELTVRIESAGTPVVIEHVAIAAGKLTRVELKKTGDEVGVSIGAPGEQSVKKIIAIVVLAAFLAASCGKNKSTPGSGSGSGLAAGSAPAAAGGAAAMTPQDPALDALAAGGADVAKLAATTPARSGQLGTLIDATAEANRAASRLAWNPAAVVESVGKDRTKLFTWVRDQTALVPYRGAMRGAVGVMMDRVGNSLDRALLLADLLTQAGIGVRLANAQLDGEAVAKLGASWSMHARPTPAPVGFDYDKLFARVVKDLALDPAQVKAATDKLDAAAGAIETKVRARIASQTAALAKLVPPPTGDPRAPDIAAFADHWWVQAEDNGVWLDLDPSLLDAEPGAVLGVAGETVVPDELTDDRRQTLTVRVIGEVWHAGVRDETTLLDHTFAPSKFFGQRISITNIAIDMPDDDTLLAAKDPEAEARAAIAAQTEWIPVLRIGTGMIVKMSVTDGGELYDVSATDANTTRLARAVQRATRAAVGGATDLLGTLPDQPGADPALAKPPPAEHSGFTAEWIELELRVPGAAPTVARRVVFDALGAADRSTAAPIKLSDAARLDRGLALVGETELLPMFARIPEAFVTDRTVAALVEGRASLVELAALGGKPPPAELRTALGKLTPMPGPLYALALARFDWSGVADQLYLDRVGVLAQQRRMVAVGPELRRRDGFDIIANDVAVWPGAGRDARAVRIAQGVADTAAEVFVMGCPIGLGPCLRGVNTSDAYAQASGAWTVATPASPPDLSTLPVAARALATADLAAGYLLIRPPAGAPATWWRVHPDTGATLGMGPTGGNETVEQIALMILGCGFGGAACIVGSHSAEQLAVCFTAVGFGAATAYAGIEYKKRRALVWVTALIAGTLGVVASGM